MSEFFKEYVVTLNNRNDLEQFYTDMESETTLEYIPNRIVECVQRRLISRNTHYKLTYQEANELKNDPRVLAVAMKPKDLGIKSLLQSEQTSVWSRSEDSIAVDQKNWGLYRIAISENISGWGSESSNNQQTTTVKFTATGKNVDIVVLDEIAYPDHSEYSEKFNQYDWFQEHREVWNGAPANYSYSSFTGRNNHATHVTGIIAGQTQGWARAANIYNLRHDTSGLTPGLYTPSEYIIDYIRSFHNSKSINSETGKRNPTLVNNSWNLGTRVSLTNPVIPESTGSKFSKIFYRGDTILPQDLGNPIVDTGSSGVCGTSTRIAQLANYANGGNRIVTTGTTSATVTSIGLSMVGRTGLVDQELPDNSSGDGVDEYDDATWTLEPPFLITYLGATYGPGGSGGTTIYASSNSYIYFGGSVSSGYEWFVGPGLPSIRKILVSGGDRSCQKLFVGTQGEAPNRTWRIRWEGHDGAYGGVEDSPTMLWEMTFYENTNNQIDLHIDQNAAYRGEFTLSQLENYGIMQTNGFGPFRDAAIDADIADAISDGIIFVASAGNSGFKIDTPEGDDYNNYYVENGEVVYYHRGSSPGNSHSNMICVGALSSSSEEFKFSSSNTGPGVDLYSPGANIISSIYDSTGVSGGPGVVNDGSPIATISTIARDSNTATITTASAHNLTNGNIISVICNSNTSFNATMVTVTVVNSTTIQYTNAGSTVTQTAGDGSVIGGYLYQKYSGTSMAAAQVTGVLALALETYPDMNQQSAKEYILRYAKQNLISDSEGGFTDPGSLQQGNNSLVFYYKERPDNGNVFPKINTRLRPASGMVFPRTRIKKS
jgi:hypothetical protein